MIIRDNSFNFFFNKLKKNEDFQCFTNGGEGNFNLFLIGKGWEGWFSGKNPGSDLYSRKGNLSYSRKGYLLYCRKGYLPYCRKGYLSYSRKE
jgi:hypothetical protein